MTRLLLFLVCILLAGCDSPKLKKTLSDIPDFAALTQGQAESLENLGDSPGRNSVRLEVDGGSACRMLGIGFDDGLVTSVHCNGSLNDDEVIEHTQQLNRRVGLVGQVRKPTGKEDSISMTTVKVDGEHPLAFKGRYTHETYDSVIELEIDCPDDACRGKIDRLVREMIGQLTGVSGG